MLIDTPRTISGAVLQLGDRVRSLEIRSGGSVTPQGVQGPVGLTGSPPTLLAGKIVATTSATGIIRVTPSAAIIANSGMQIIGTSPSYVYTIASIDSTGADVLVSVVGRYVPLQPLVSTSVTFYYLAIGA